LYEAATIDGAQKMQQIWNITLPGILPTIAMMLALRMGGILNAGFEQILVMYNPGVYSTADIIDTFVYRVGLGKMDYSFGTAAGLFNSVIGFIMVIGGNYLSKRVTEHSIW
jgi:putative aldouronate transport system permease protein